MEAVEVEEAEETIEVTIWGEARGNKIIGNSGTGGTKAENLLGKGEGGGTVTSKLNKLISLETKKT